MKNSQFITLVLILILGLLLGFWIVIHQNDKLYELMDSVGYWVHEVNREDIKKLDEKIDWLQDSVHGYWVLIYRIVEYME